MSIIYFYILYLFTIRIDETSFSQIKEKQKLNNDFKDYPSIIIKCLVIFFLRILNYYFTFIYIFYRINYNRIQSKINK